MQSRCRVGPMHLQECRCGAQQVRISSSRGDWCAGDCAGALVHRCKKFIGANMCKGAEVVGGWCRLAGAEVVQSRRSKPFAEVQSSEECIRRQC